MLVVVVGLHYGGHRCSRIQTLVRIIATPMLLLLDRSSAKTQTRISKPKVLARATLAGRVPEVLHG